MEAWYRVVTPRKEVREGRSFNPDEFAIHLEQVVAGTAPIDYRDPGQFFARTCFTRALREHAGMVLRRLAGRTDNTSPVLMLVTQFGGGKTHTLTTLYHLARTGPAAASLPGVEQVLAEVGLDRVPAARVGVFVGNAWDPQPGRETPWIDLARQLAGDRGVELLGPQACSTPPGTAALGEVFRAAGGSVLILCDEVLNFVNRHRGFAEPFHAFIQNLTVAMTGTTCGAAVISLPRSQVEMTDWDLQWQDRITKVVRRVARDLITNDEAEISEVIRRRLFEDLGGERLRRNVARAYAEWCFERRERLPHEWTAVDTASTDRRAREHLQARFEACYPFHPATLSVFQRKWRALTQYQQTRGTLAMLAQWISWALRDAYTQARREPLITLGSAPLEVPGFLAVVLGQLGQDRLLAAIDADVTGATAHARALDADTDGPLRDIHRRAGAAILFESSGGQADKVAHLPELRFALGGPDLDTTSIDSAVMNLASKAYYIRPAGSDGYKIHHQPTLKKVKNDRKASLDPDKEVRPAVRALVEKEFEKAAAIRPALCPADSTAIPESTRLLLVVADPEWEWTGAGPVREQVANWTLTRGGERRLYPGALIWCIRQPGRDLRDKVEEWLAWKRVQEDLNAGILGAEFDRSEKAEIHSRVASAEYEARDQVWADYRFVVLLDTPSATDRGTGAKEGDGLRVIDLGVGHPSANESLCGRALAALRSAGLLNEGVGVSYLERHWPPALKASGAWPLTTLRQSFLNGALTRLPDPDTILRKKIVEFVTAGEFGLASGERPDGTFERIWHAQPLAPEEVTFEAGVYLLTRAKAQALKSRPAPRPVAVPDSGLNPPGGAPPDTRGMPPVGPEDRPASSAGSPARSCTLRLTGSLPPETWNRAGTKLVSRLRSAGEGIELKIDFTVLVPAGTAASLEADLKQALQDLGIEGSIRIEKE